MKKKTLNVTEEELRKERGGKILPFVRPTRRLHESGFRIFEVGYCNSDGTKEAVIGRCSDHIYWSEPMDLRRTGKQLGSFNMDLDKQGRIRFYRGFQWDHIGSSSFLVYVAEKNL